MSKLPQDHYSASRALELAQGNWERVITSLSRVTSAMLDPKKHFACPVHGGKDGFRVFSDFAETGGCICNSCGSFKNGLAMLMWLNGTDYNTTIRQVVDLLDPVSIETARKKTSQKPASPENPASGNAPENAGDQKAGGDSPVNRIWHLAQPISYRDTASKYFAARGIMCIGKENRNLSYGLRFLPNALVHNLAKTEQHPAIIAAVRDNKGNLINVHKTFLNKEGTGKADINNPKRLAALPEGASMSGGAIYFQEIEKCKGVMLVAEGIETALSAWFHYGCLYPAAALISATMMPSWIPPEGVTRVIIFADRDRAGANGQGVGQEAAKRLGQSLAAKGIHGNILLPPGMIMKGQHSRDWNDVLMDGDPFPNLDIPESEKSK